MRTLSALTVERAHARQLDRFYDVLSAKAFGSTFNVMPDTYTRAAVTGLNSADDVSLAEPVQAFAILVAEMSAFGRLRPFTLQTSPHIRIPTPVTDPPGFWVGEGRPMPFGRAVWSHVQTSASKVGTIFVGAKELFGINDPRLRTLVTRQASRQLARVLDRVLLGTDAATSDNPAGLLAAAPALGGGSPADVGRDIAELFAYVSDGRPTSPVIVLAPRTAVYLNSLDESMFRSVGIGGGSIAGIPVIPAAAAGNRIILLDAEQIATFDGGVEVQPSEAASVQMDDSPTNNAATGTGAQLVSLFQTGSVAVKLMQFCDWRLMSDDAIAFVELTEIGGSPV